MKKKVVFFIPTLEAGGAEKNVIKLLSGVSKEKYQTVLLVGKKRGEFLKDVPSSIPVFELGTLSSIMTFFKMIGFLKRQKPDLFVSNLSRFNVINLLAHFFSGSNSRIIVVEHTQVSLLPLTAKSFLHRIFARYIFPSLASFLYKAADCVVAVSGGVASDLKKVLRGKVFIKVLYNPVVDKSILDFSKDEVNQIWFNKKEVPVILSVGRLVGAKNHELLLRTVKLVLEKVKVNLVVLGQGHKKEYLEKLVFELGIKDAVHFIGFQENPFKYMARADVFVSSSSREGFGNSIVEAMALGLPVVSTDCSGPAEIIQDAGILVPVEDASSLAKAILTVLGDDNLRMQMIERGLRRANDFLVQSSVNSYEKLFDELLYE